MTQHSRVIDSIHEVAKKSMPKGGRMLLFGSQARGDFHQDSDWDILILLDKARLDYEDYDIVAYPFVEMGWKMGIAINPLLYTYSDWEKRKFTQLYKNIEQDGIELWH